MEKNSKQQHERDNLKRVPKDASGLEANSLAEIKGRGTPLHASSNSAEQWQHKE
jgi:hypothetical protein